MAADRRPARALGRADAAAARPAVAGTHFFDPARAATPILYQHVFWFFGHPEVYIMVLPVFGIDLRGHPGVRAQADLRLQGDRVLDGRRSASSRCSSGRTTCSRSGCRPTSTSSSCSRSMVIAVPTGMKIFNWLATLWRGNISFDTPMLFALGFICVFTIGGLSGIFLAAFPVDWQVTDTLLRRRALPLRPLRRLDASAIFGGPLLLVAEDLRAHALRAARQVDVLAASSSAST